MAPTPPTVVSLKQSFLSAQTRLLSQPLAPTRAWRSSNSNNNNDEDHAALPDKAIDDALFKLNHRLQQHARRVYAPQATRHVAEQIDQLYWNAAEAASARDLTEGDDGELEAAEGLTLGADLADPSTIATLPLDWDPNPDNNDQSPETKRYTTLAADLHALAERKQHATARVARLRRMQALLEPFSSPNPPASSGGGDGDGSGGGVQDNLVTRNGAVEAELSRMRMLLARVGGRVGRLREEGEAEGERRGGGGSVEAKEQRKVGLLLERF